VVVGTVVVLLCRNACWCMLCILIIYSSKIDAFDAGGNIEGWWGIISSRIAVLGMHSPDKVTMVMMTLLAFPHREAYRFHTGEVLGA